MPGCVLTFDALHAVKETIEAVVDKRADVLVCVKDNASDLRSRLETHLNREAGRGLEGVGSQAAMVPGRSL